MALALVAAACSSKSGTPSNSTPTGGKAAFNAALTGIVNPSDKKGGTLHLVNSSDLDSWDPAITYYGYGWNLNRLYTRTLMGYPTKPGTDGLKLVPDAAADVPTISSDGKTYTFKLKSGLKFDDGTPVTSKDFKYGIERVFAQDVLPGGPTYPIDFLDQGQHYPGPYKDKDPNKLGLKSVETPDDSTIVFHLASPFGDFQYLLAMPDTGPVPVKRDTGAKYTNAPASSGPYKVQSYQPGKKIVFTRNTYWDPATDTIRKALPDEIDVDLGLDTNEIDNRLLDGSADIDVGQTGVQQAAQTKILLDPKLKASADEPTTGAIRYFNIIPFNKPTDNIHCRNAIIYAMDGTAMQTARGGPDAGGALGINMLPPNIAGYDANYDPFTLKQGHPQVDKAKQEMAACGKPNGFSVVIASRNKGKEPKTAQALQQALSAVGIKSTIQQYDASQYFSSVIGSPSNVRKQGYNIALEGWSADFPTGYGFLQPLIDGRVIRPSGNYNVSELNDPAINGLIDQAKAESDPTKAAAIWTQVNQKVMETSTYVPFTYDKALNYRNPRVTNVYVTLAFGEYDFQAMGVS
jgi:peptide/nickel transport system substrate-binding protein